MTTDELKTFQVVLDIRATCKADAKELIMDYMGEETDVNIISVIEVQ